MLPFHYVQTDIIGTWQVGIATENLSTKQKPNIYFNAFL